MKSLKLLLLVSLFPLMGLTACKKNESSNTPGSSGSPESKSTSSSLRPEMIGEWYAGEGPDHRITVSPGGISSAGVECSRSIAVESWSCDGMTCRWESSEKTYDKKPVYKGSVTFVPAETALYFQTTGVWCGGTGLSGKGTKIKRDSGTTAAATTTAAPPAPSNDDEPEEPKDNEPSRDNIGAARGLSNLTCATDCLTTQTECLERCGGQDMSCAVRCSGDWSRCVQRCR